MRKKDFIAYLKEQEKPVVHLLNRIPDDKLAWRPMDTVFTLGRLAAHMATGCPNSLTHMTTGNWPSDFSEPESMTGSEAAALYSANLKKAITALEGITEDDWANGTRSAPWAPAAPTAMHLFAMVEHIGHHKMQLFLYLKMLGLEHLDTGALYMGHPFS